MDDGFVYSEWVKTGLHDLLSQLRKRAVHGSEPDSSFIPAYLALTNQFYYITDFLNVRNQYVHPNVQSLLGYAPEDLLDLDFIGSIIHPEDRDFVVAFSVRSVRFTMEHVSYIRNDLHCGTFSIDFRIRKRNGEYMRVNRLTSAVKADVHGKMTHAVSFFTDISYLKHDDHIRCCLIGENLPAFPTDDLYRMHSQVMLSKREKEIIQMLAQGMEGKEIAEELHISEHTVISHRKNILRKTQMKNTASLVKFATDRGIIQ
jgi:DNA-binding CsgD family transcriptional regulator